MPSIPPSGPALAALRVHTGRGTAATIPLTGSVVLGRDPVAGVAIASDSVSREHARLLWDGKSWWIEDLHSTNGTFVNGEPVAREKVQHLDVVSLGRADMVFVIRSGEPAKVRQGIVRAALVSQEEGAVHEIPPGEVTLGRAVACNIVAVKTAVSKVHARVLRSADQLVLEDLGSVNGTTVNQTRVKTVVLKDGDLVALADTVHYRVVVETGVVPDTGGQALPGRAVELRRFPGHWRTRYEWDSAERAAFVAAAAGHRPPESEEVPGRTLLAKPSTPQEPRRESRPHAEPVVEPPKATVAAATQPAPSAPAPATPKAAEPPTELPTVLSRPGLSPSADAPSAAPPPAGAPPSAEKTPARATPAVGGTPRDEAKTPTVVDMPIPASRAPAAIAMARIAVIRLVGSRLNLEIPEPGRYEIGRAPTSSFRVEDNTVSRRHAAVTLDHDRAAAWVEDIGAANGTRLNGEEVQGRRALSNGDLLELGEVRLKVTLERA